MSWKLVECPNGNISNGDLLKVHELLSKSEEKVCLELVRKLDSLVEIAKYDKKRKSDWANEGGPVHDEHD